MMPSSMRDTLLKELQLSMRIMQEGSPVVPRFRISSGDGEFVLFAPAQGTLRAQRESARFIKGFMLLHLARWFIFSSETKKQPGVASYLVARDERLGVARSMKRNPPRFGELRWLDHAAICQGILELLPERSATISGRLYQETLSRLRRKDIEIAGPF